MNNIKPEKSIGTQTTDTFSAKADVLPENSTRGRLNVILWVGNQ